MNISVKKINNHYIIGMSAVNLLFCVCVGKHAGKQQSLSSALRLLKYASLRKIMDRLEFLHQKLNLIF